MKCLAVVLTIGLLSMPVVGSSDRGYIDRVAPVPHDGFSYSSEIDDLGFKALTRQILRVITEMHKTQLEILKHEEKIDANIQRIADKLDK